MAVNGRCSIACTGSFEFIPDGDYELEISIVGRNSAFRAPLNVQLKAPYGLAIGERVTSISSQSRLSETKRIKIRKHSSYLGWGLGSLAMGGLAIGMAIFAPVDSLQTARWIVGGLGLLVGYGLVENYASNWHLEAVMDESAIKKNRKLGERIVSRNAKISERNRKIKNETVMRLTLRNQL